MDSQICQKKEKCQDKLPDIFELLTVKHSMELKSIELFFPSGPAPLIPDTELLCYLTAHLTLPPPSLFP
jgi:hypothetical protein